MEKFVLQFIFFFLCLLINKKKKGAWLIPSNFILGLYTLCSLFAIPSIDIWGLKQALGPEYWIPLIVFDFCVFLFLYPFFSFREDRFNSLILPSRSILDIFSNVIIVLSLFSIIYILPSVREAFSLENLASARTDIELGNSFHKPGLLNTIASVSSSLNIFPILLFFIYSAIGDCKFRLVLLLISSLSEPIYILSFVGRDGIVFWLFATIFCYLLCKPYLRVEFIKKFNILIWVIFILILIPFMLISISRFEESDYGMIGSIISYLGQGFVNGPLLFGIDNLRTTGGSCFPLFFEITGIEPPKEIGSVQIGDWCSWYFSTTIGSFYRDLGALGLSILLCVFNIYFRNNSVKIRKKCLPFNFIIIYLLYFRLVAEGVFYFREYTRGGNFFIVLLLLSSLYFSKIDYCNGVILKKKYDCCK